MTAAERPVDLRSDTVTRPTAAMRAAIAAAPVGDDVFGDDPTVRALERRIAALLGFEAALFVPSGTQSNLLAIMGHCERGDEYLVGQYAHCYRWEGGGAAVLGSVQPQPLAHRRDGTLALDEIEAAIKPDDPHFARTRLLALENTFGGRPMPLDWLAEATALARRRGLATHLDGARLFNAAVVAAASRSGDVARATPATVRPEPVEGPAGTPGRPDAAEIEAAARRIAAHFDSVSVCFSKGLGAPVGSALVGSAALIGRARRWRKLLGGGMRQAGVLAAGALHALDHHLERLADDHANARRLADGLAALPGVTLEAPATNIVFADLAGPHAAGFVDALAAQGVLATGSLYGAATRVRFVTHLDVDSAGIDRALVAARATLGGAAG